MAVLLSCTFLLKLLFIRTLSLLRFVRATMFSLFTSFIGLSDIQYVHAPEHNFHDPTPKPVQSPASAVLIRELLPAMKFGDLPSTRNKPPPESCLVCLYEFEGGEDINTLINCDHIYHKSCFDTWLDYDHRTCPVCKKHLVPRELQKEFKGRLWDAFCAGEDIYVE